MQAEAKQEGDEASSGVLITEEALAQVREEIGRAYKIPQYNSVATPDAIRHYALGMGDDNPLWIDPEYGVGTRWGQMIAPSLFIMSCGFPRSRGLPGVHGLFTGIDLHCHEPIKAGTPITAMCSLYKLEEKQGRYAGRQFQQVFETNYSDDNGKVLSTLYSHNFRTERKGGKSGGKYAGIERQRYDDAMRARIEADLDAEKRNRRGAETLYFEDVKVGDKIPAVVKGPLTVTDCICFLMGFGYIFVKAHRQAYEFRKRHPGAGILDNYGVWDIPERVHWEDDLPKQIGMPAAYDYGPQRIGWFDHCVSDWKGDDGFTRRLSVRVSAPNFIGDTTWISGTVTRLDPEAGVAFIDLEAIDQRGRINSTGQAEVVLQRR